MRVSRLSASCLCALMAAGLSSQAFAIRVEGEPMRPELAKAQPRNEQFRTANFAALSPAKLEFLAIGNDRIGALKRYNDGNNRSVKPLQIGIGRDMASESAGPMDALKWTQVSGGKVARIDVTSPQAKGLRVGFTASTLLDNAEIRVASADNPSRVFAVTGKQAKQLVDASGRHWTAWTDGETQIIELFVPDLKALDVPEISAVTHFVISPAQDSLTSKALGESATCNVNAVCKNDFGQTYINAKNAVTRTQFQSGTSGFTCTGTLLNDSTPNTQVPYIYTAHHCFKTQAEANTLVTFWGFESATCGNRNDGGTNVQVGGGAELLYSQGTSDGALLRMNNSPPTGAYFAGWDAAQMIPNTPVTALHHPAGDNKKVSLGNHSGIQGPINIGTGSTISSTNRASWSEGTTERGSSGSGLFTNTTGSYLLRGGLAGGNASCANSGGTEAGGNVDYYSRLDQIFPSIKQFLGDGTTATGPTRNYIGNWFSASQNGIGLDMIQVDSARALILYYAYNDQGDPRWYEFEPIWTGQDVLGGRVVRWKGTPWTQPYNPADRVPNVTGSYTLRFVSATEADLTITGVDGVSRTTRISKVQ